MSYNLTSFIYLDRYRNEGTRTYSDQSGYTEALPHFRHNSGQPDFKLDLFSLPREKMNVYAANPPSAIQNRYLEGDKVMFAVHPQIRESGFTDPYTQRALALGTLGSPILVSPSSSTRTLYVRDLDHPHALKVHFPFRISRYGRKMRDEVVAQAIAISMELETGIDAFDPDFAIMREVLGITHPDLEPGSGRGENWGFLVRDLTPFPLLSGQKDNSEMIPGFALYGKDFFDPQKPELLFELIGEANPVTFVLDHIMLPVVRQWIACYLNFGFMLEPHGQNLILETDRDGKILRTVHRDLSLGIDMRRRRDLNLLSEHLNTYNRMEDGRFASITYDKFMGHHFFDQIIACLNTRFSGLKQDLFSGPCREEFQRLFADHARYLPEQVQYFSKTRDQFGKPFYEDTGQKPVYRP